MKKNFLTTKRPLPRYGVPVNTTQAGHRGEEYMKINRLFAKVAVGTLALATVMMTGVMFSACSKNNKDSMSDEDKYVDLGLPSGVKWAKCNLGAAKPSDSGDYYSWGETEPKTDYSWASYKWMQEGMNDWSFITKYTKDDGKKESIWYNGAGQFIGDGKTTLEAADDVVTAKLGSSWRMPTSEEVVELCDKCSWTWSTQDGKKGYEVKGPNGNSIFLPATGTRFDSKINGVDVWGFYWSKSLSVTNSKDAMTIFFDNLNSHYQYAPYRYYGFVVRPVHP